MGLDKKHVRADMKTQYIIILVIVVMLFGVEICKKDVTPPEPDKIISMTNEYRVSQGLNTLEKDDVLCEVAEIRAKEIVNTWSHTRPDGTKFYNILDDMSYQMNGAGENIGRYQESEEEVMNMWKESESHNKNMLGDYTKMGVAVYQEDGKYFFVQIFAR